MLAVPSEADADVDALVAILTDLVGPVLGDPVEDGVEDVAQVAILTAPEGAVLAAIVMITVLIGGVLRSSLTPLSGRCWLPKAPVAAWRPLVLRSSLTPRAGAGCPVADVNRGDYPVAILTDPVGDGAGPGTRAGGTPASPERRWWRRGWLRP